MEILLDLLDICWLIMEKANDTTIQTNLQQLHESIGHFVHQEQH